MLYFIETDHGVLVDVVNEIKTARRSAKHEGHYRMGKEPCRIYINGPKGEKIYIK